MLYKVQFLKIIKQLFSISIKLNHSFRTVLISRYHVNKQTILGTSETQITKSSPSAKKMAHFHLALRYFRAEIERLSYRFVNISKKVLFTTATDPCFGISQMPRKPLSPSFLQPRFWPHTEKKQCPLKLLAILTGWMSQSR